MLLYPVNKKLDRPNELQKVKNTKMLQVVGTFPIILKLYKDVEDINPNQNHEKIANIFGYFAKMAIRKYKNSE